MSELFTIKRILARRLPAEFGCTQCTPANAEPSIVEAGKRCRQATRIRHALRFGYKHIIHQDLASRRTSHRKLALDLDRLKPLHATLEYEAIDDVILGLRPNDHDVGNRRVRDPSLCAGKPGAVLMPARPRHHAAGVGAMIRLGQAETAELFGARHGRQITLPLFLTAEQVDRHHS